ncbi:MAG: pilus assembly protein TadG-related protein [Planctomycetaceae bacterium]|nr:pilus assembly protein TadG-related protein [Planctomycetaceae bacterium]
MMRKSDCHSSRRGKVTVLLVLLLPAVFGTLALVVDGSRLMSDSGQIQHIADAAAVAAAASLSRGDSVAIATQRAITTVQVDNGLSSASVTVHIPPQTGVYAGQDKFAEVTVNRIIPMSFLRAVNGESQQSVSATAVAGLNDATAGAAIVVLDPDPPAIDLPPVLGLTLPTMPSHHLGGLEVLGVGAVKVDGAVLVNTDWGGVDEDGSPAGWSLVERNAVTCTPLVSLSKLRSRDLRVVGGVDNPNNYTHFISGEPSPLRANAKPVPDPLISVPVPTVAADPTNVSSTLRGGVTVVGIPLIGLPTVLSPGVYEYIQIVSGRVTLNPGVYIIRGSHPVTKIPLQIIGGEVTGNGVMFYITNSAAYSPTSGLPDSGDGSTTPAATGLGTVLPSAVINIGLLGSNLTAIGGSSPYAGLLIFQRRADRRILVIARDALLSDSVFNGTVYAKWGDTVFAGMGTVQARFVVGSLRFANLLDCTIAPTSLLPPAQDVFLVQ